VNLFTFLEFLLPRSGIGGAVNLLKGVAMELPKPKPIIKKTSKVKIDIETIPVPALIKTSPSFWDIMKMGAYRFMRGAIAGTGSAALAMSVKGVKGVADLGWGLLAGLVGGGILAVDKMIREFKKTKYKGELNQELVDALLKKGGFEMPDKDNALHFVNTAKVAAVKLRSVMGSGAVLLMLNFLSDLLVMLIENYQSETSRKHIQTVAWLVKRYESELRKIAADTTTALDDKVVDGKRRTGGGDAPC